MSKAFDGTYFHASGAACFSAVEEVYDEEIHKLVEERTYGCTGAEGSIFQVK